MLVFPLRMLGMWIGEGQRATASGERIFQVVDEPEDMQDAGGATVLPPGTDGSPSRASPSATRRDGPCSRGSTSSSSPAGPSR